MKVVFAGPSLYGTAPAMDGLTLLPPASRGDIAAATRNGATHIGLIDGYFGWVASVWHKEILFALESGVTVMGAASMGALRAADCASFGMLPVGRIAHWYTDGTLDDDADVAILHAPAELGYMPLTEALVDARATLDIMLLKRLIATDEHARLHHAAAALNFRDRTSDAIVALALPHARQAAVIDLYATNRLSLKAEDATLLVERMASVNSETAPKPDWTMAPSFTWLAADL